MNGRTAKIRKGRYGREYNSNRKKSGGRSWTLLAGGYLSTFYIIYKIVYINITQLDYILFSVGSQGLVISYEIIKQHHKLAKKNFWQWCNAWKIGRGKEWPNNVDFINQDILTAAEDLKSITLDAVSTVCVFLVRISCSKFKVAWRLKTDNTISIISKHL